MTTFLPDRFYRPSEIWRLSRAPRALVYASLASGQLKAIRRGSRYPSQAEQSIAWIEEIRDGRGAP